MNLTKHRYNFFPEMPAEDRLKLENDLRDNGYDETQPIYIYQNAVLDGWNRYVLCNELSLTPKIIQYEGNDIDAIAFVMRTNKRRNLNSSQWAAASVNAQEIVNKIKQSVEEVKKKAQSANAVNRFTSIASVNNFTEAKKENPDKRATAQIAKEFNTNHQYVSQLTKIKEENPALFDKVSAGEISVPEAVKVDKIEQKKEAAQKEDWTKEEQELMNKLKRGETVVINMHKHLKVLSYAESKGIYVRIDRFSEWGNPFVMDEDGTRDEVCDWFAEKYFPFKKGLHKKIKLLKGKILGCHCFPNRCHGETLKFVADGN